MYQYIAHCDGKSSFIRRLFNQPPHKVITKSENMFFVLVKSTHGGGYYFVGHISEQENRLSITGKIVHNPDRNGNSQITQYSLDEKIRHFFQFSIGLLLFWWAGILMLIIDLFCRIFAKGKDMTLEDILDEFMIHALGCEKIDEPHQ